ncbi:MAG: hypothetical protein Q8736_02425, partial [Sweet potato little leaf phytoplasma]|nr:hypothetical protein [Sweet potato little leaf phytoplasma]
IYLRVQSLQPGCFSGNRALSLKVEEMKEDEACQLSLKLNSFYLVKKTKKIKNNAVKVCYI